uniref:Vomeronasal type-1 receptor n=2 Tax=Latimeria chalumnae TaxID=7897 RepID=H3BH77_LATCH
TMGTWSIIKGTAHFILTVIGMPGNLIIVYAFSYAAYSDHKLMPADIIVLNLALVNLMVVLVRCIPEMLAAYGINELFSDSGCKIVICIYRTTRALSIWLTFLLSGFQCISIAPITTKWAAFKLQAPGHLFGVLAFLWVFNVGFSIPALLYGISSSGNSTGNGFSINLEYCFVKFPSQYVKITVGNLQISRDIIPIFLMIFASVYILLILYHHSQQVKHLQSSNRKRGSSAEIRAAKAVITLVLLYVIFFGIDNVLWVYTLTIKAMTTSVISDLRVFFSSLYAAVSPIVIIVSNKKVQKRLKCEREQQGSLAPETVTSTVRM